MMKSILKSKLFISLILLVTAATAAVVITVNVGHSGNDLQTQLDLGKKYVSELDYENAIIAYEEALKIDPYCLDAYLGLSDAYMALGQPDKAIEVLKQAKNMLPESVEVYAELARLYASQNQIDLVVSVLEEGIKVTDSDQLREMLREYQPEPSASSEKGSASPVNPEESEEEVIAEQKEPFIAIGLQPDVGEQTAAPVLVINQNREEPVEIPLAVQSVLPAATMDDNDGSSDADEESGNSSSNHSSGNHSGGSDESSNRTEEPPLPRTGINGNVYDINGQVIEGVTINIYASGTQTPLTTSTNQIGSYLQELTAGTYRVVLSKEGYIDISTILLVAADTLTSNSYIMLTTEESRQSASFKGIVISAINSQNIEGVTIALLNGFDQMSNGNPNVIAGVGHTTTGADGTFSINDGMKAGYYTVEASKDGYSTYLHNETLKPGKNEFTINMSPVIQTQGEYRIVLTWGEKPRDLDSHLFCSGNSNYHIFFGNKESSDGNAFLDWDDVTSYGPETTTVKIGEGNYYTYAVHNYTDNGASLGENAAWNLASSGARVVVYAENGIIFDGNVPVNQQGTVWEVFRIENGRLTVTNTMSFEYPSAEVVNNVSARVANINEETVAANEEEMEINVLNENTVQALQETPAFLENTMTEEIVLQENRTEEPLESDDEINLAELTEGVNMETCGTNSEETATAEEELQQNDEDEMSETGEAAEPETYVKPESVTEEEATEDVTEEGATENVTEEEAIEGVTEEEVAEDEKSSEMEKTDREEASEEITEETDGQQ